MNTLFVNAILLPMTRGDEEEKLFHGALGVVGDEIEFVSEDEAEVERFKKQ